MNREDQDLHQLATRVSCGDAEAASELQEHLKPLMTRILRRALRNGGGDTKLTRQLQGGVDDVCNGSWAQLDRSQELFPALVARRMCDRIVGRLSSGLAIVAE